MCGGISEMQSRLPPRLHEEMKHAPADMTTARCRHQPAPAGLAIVAALVQSGGTLSSHNKAAESAPSSPIPISSSSSSSSSASAYEKINNNRKDNFPSYKQSDHNISIDQPTVKNHSRHAQTSIFSTSFSPPGCNSYVMSSNLYRDLYDDFLGVCLSCKRPLAPGKDIYMYRGDQAFCSTECRHKHIVADENLLCNIQINQPCVQASSPTNKPKFTPSVAIAISV